MSFLNVSFMFLFTFWLFYVFYILFLLAYSLLIDFILEVRFWLFSWVFSWIFVLFCLLTCLFFYNLSWALFLYLLFSLFSNHAMQLAGSWFPRQELGLGLQGGNTESKILECWRSA